MEFFSINNDRDTSLSYISNSNRTTWTVLDLSRNQVSPNTSLPTNATSLSSRGASLQPLNSKKGSNKDCVYALTRLTVKFKQAIPSHNLKNTYIWNVKAQSSFNLVFTTFKNRWTIKVLRILLTYSYVYL